LCRVFFFLSPTRLAHLAGLDAKEVGKDFLLTPKLTSSDHFRRVCDKCEKAVFGDKEWKDHLASRYHRKRRKRCKTLKEEDTKINI
jgi:hypothetical protein